jgi:spore coat protein U-like protein
MRNVLFATVAFTVLSSGGAMAAGSAAVLITATQPQLCQVNSFSPSLDLGNAVNVPIVGSFVYQCNFTGSPTMKFTSLNGGVHTASDGGHTADYGIYLNDAAPSSAPSTWLQASTATGGVTYNGITSSTTAGTPVSPSFQVGLTQTLPVAGSYADTMTIDIAP